MRSYWFHSGNIINYANILAFTSDSIQPVFTRSYVTESETESEENRNPLTLLLQVIC